MKRPIKILWGLILGIVFGILCHHFFKGSAWLDVLNKSIAEPMGQIFLRLIFMIVVPLVFSSLILGVFEMGDFKSLGRVGLKTLIYTLFSSTTSVLIGIFLVQVFKPGVGLNQELVQNLFSKTEQSTKVIEQARSAKSFIDILISLVPKNPLGAAVSALDGEMVSLMIFALIFGAGLTLVRAGKNSDPLVGLLTSVRDVSMKIVDFAMALAPFGVFGLMFSLTSKVGPSLLWNLSQYVLVVFLGLLIQQFIVYGALLKFYVGENPFRFFYRIREVIITAFSTASSNATLPTSLRVAENELGIDRKISSFVLTIGSTANQNGTALFEGVTILFLAQVFSVDLSFTQQITVLIMSVIAGVGTAGVPGGSIPLIVIVLQSVGVPPEGIGLILGVDRFLDMCRTVLNVTGDIVATSVINHSESA